MRVPRPIHMLAVVVALGAAALLLRTDAPEDQKGTTGSNPAPQFVAQTLDSLPQRRTLADYAGAPLILNVWATWCDPCREEMPSFERLYRDYKSRGLRIAAISIDDGGSAELVREFVKEHSLSFDILLDPKADVMSQYAVRGVPETFLISRSGEIVGRRYVADWDAPSNRRTVDSLLAIGAEEAR